MTKVNITIESDGLNIEQASILSAFLQSIQCKSVEVPEEAKDDFYDLTKPLPNDQKIKATRTRAKKEEPAIVIERDTFDQAAINEIEVEAEIEEEDPKEETKIPTLAEIRSEVFIKKDTHKDVIKAKIK